MSKVDKLKEEIGWLKVTYAILAAVYVSLVAWVAQNLKTADTALVALAVLVMILVGVAIITVNYAAYRRIKELGDL